jgi:hypothetical protein
MPADERKEAVRSQDVRVGVKMMVGGRDCDCDGDGDCDVNGDGACDGDCDA